MDGAVIAPRKFHAPLLMYRKNFGGVHVALPAEVKHARGMEAGGIRLSVDLEDWLDIIHDLETALEQV